MASPAPPPPPGPAASSSAPSPSPAVAASAPPPQPPPPPPPQQPTQQQPKQPPPRKICFNAHCKDPKSEGPRRRGWRLRSGDFAELCDRCYASFEQGSFCETFHSGVAGWRNCEACGKRLHCGCIVSVHAYVLLDAGGVDCILCARKSHALAASQMWSSSMHVPQGLADRKESYVKSWKPPAGPFPGHWRQANMWNMSSIQSDLQQRLAYEFDRPSSSEKLLPGRTSIHAQEKKFDDMHDRLAPSSMNQIIRERFANAHSQHSGLDPSYSYTLYHREGANPNGLHDPSHLGGENDPMPSRKGVISDPCSAISTGFNLDAHPNSHPSPILKEDPSSLPVGLASNFPSTNGPKDPVRISSTQQQAQLASSSLSKQFYPQNVIDSEFQAQMRNGRPRMDAKGRSQLLPRYWPRITDQELQQITGDSNSVITPLFEKMLSASDAGRIGRLVLPKKCAEAYFPPISQPEGLPLKVQDATGKEWVFQFRFWPNNNSRMYVLEGVTPCIQSMQLQAGDTVTFSRIDPEGKLVMGFRKASNLSSSEQEQTTKAANGLSTPPEVNGKVSAPDSSPNTASRQNKVNNEAKGSSSTEQATAGPKLDKGGVAQKEGHGPAARAPPGHVKRKASCVGAKIKRLRIDNEESLELKITWEEAQELLRPPPNKTPSIVLVDGHEFEEYELPPVLGRRTYFVTDQAGESHQWAQCEDCSKWRKLPVGSLLPSKFTCSDNKWDPERSSCTSAQDISVEQLSDIIPVKPGPGKRSKVKVETETIEATEGLDTLANLAILGEGDALPSQPTTRHPRHRPGCTCIVCIQPPSGKGPKHKQTCTCNVCLTVRRRFKTLMLRREKRQSEKDAESARKQNQPSPSGETTPQTGSGAPPATTSTSGSPQKADANTEGPEEVVIEHKIISSPMKNQIDLNIQPEREDEQSPKSDAGSMMRLNRDAPT